MESSNYLVTQVGFVLITIVFIGWFVKEIFTGISLSDLKSKKKIRNNILMGLLAWFAIVSSLSLSGVLKDFSSMPPRMMIVLFIPLVTIILITRSDALGKIISKIPAQNLIRLQVFRVVVEILLWMLFIQNLLPKQMTFEGRNFDVVAGATAPFIAYLFSKNKTLMIIWNFIGLGLLLNIVTIAVLSMPLPFRFFMNEPSNTIVSYFPIVLLPAFLVPLAYTLHFFSLKQLFSKN